MPDDACDGRLNAEPAENQARGLAGQPCPLPPASAPDLVEPHAGAVLHAKIQPDSQGHKSHALGLSSYLSPVQRTVHTADRDVLACMH
jgi:hypothetical protein